MTGTMATGSPALLQTQTPGAISTYSIMLSGEAMCLGVGTQNGGGPSYVSVVLAAAGRLPQWQLQYLGPAANGYKYYIGTEDGQFWWSVPSNTPLENCVSFVAGQNGASTIIIVPGNETYTLEAAYGPGEFMAPVGFARGFYLATDQAASAPVVFLASG